MTVLENIVKVFPRTIISNHIEKKVFVLDNNKTPDQNINRTTRHKVI